MLSWCSKASRRRWKRKRRWGRSSSTTCRSSSRQSSRGWWSSAARHVSAVDFSSEGRDIPVRSVRSSAERVPLSGTVAPSCHTLTWCREGRRDQELIRAATSHSSSPEAWGGCSREGPSERQQKLVLKYLLHGMLTMNYIGR